MKKWLLLAVVAALVLGLGVLAAFLSHRSASHQQRAEAAARAPALAAQATLSPDDACWLVRDWLFTGQRNGRTPVIDCEGALEPVPNGLRLTGVLRSSDFASGRHPTTLCLSRGAQWAVLGGAWELNDCRSLPARGGDVEAAARAVADQDKAAALVTIEAVRAALKDLARGLPACTALGLPRSAVGFADERRLVDPSADPIPRVIPHDVLFAYCLGAPPHFELPDAARYFRCRPRPEWTHVVVVHLDDFSPPRRLTDDHFAGGTLEGALVVVELATRSVRCASPFGGALPERVVTSRSGSLAEAFSALVKVTLDDATVTVVARR